MKNKKIKRIKVNKTVSLYQSDFDLAEKLRDRSLECGLRTIGKNDLWAVALLVLRDCTKEQYSKAHIEVSNRDVKDFSEE
jgi:hypothetical protein